MLPRVALTIAVTVALSFAAGLAAAAGPSAGGTDESVREGPRVLKAGEHGVGRLVPDVAFLDVDGKPGRLAEARGRRVTVVCMTGAGCPLAKKYGPTLADLSKRYADQGAAFVLVNADTNESPDRVRAASATLRGQGLVGRYVHDRTSDLAAALGATSSTEAFVLDAARTLVYRGAVDDQFGLGYALPAPRRNFLIDAINAALDGDEPAVAATTAPGCALDAKAAPGTSPASAVTYHNRVSRIVQQNCQECHRRGESGPFEMNTYGELKDHLAMVRKVVRRGSMPPWFADPKHGHWANDRSLLEGDKADLLAWIDAGAPEGDPADAPAPRRFADGWRIGKPDQVFAVAKPVGVPARGPIPYQHAVIETKLDRDRWVEAIEVRTSQPQVTHHLLVFVAFPAGDPRAKGRPDVMGGLNGYFAALVPNQGVNQFPPGAGKLLPKGARLILQIHYTPDGTAVNDTPRVGVRYAHEQPAHEVVTLAASNQGISIPPGASDHVERASYRFRGPARLLSFLPHSHVRGKGFRYELQYPDGRTEVVLDLPRYDFNWQLEYHLRDPIDVPAGAVLRATAWYDNSKANPANPDPTKRVRYGPQTTDEMMICYFTGYRLPDPADAKADGSW